MPKDHPSSATEVADKEINHYPAGSRYGQLKDTIDERNTLYYSKAIPKFNGRDSRRMANYPWRNVA